ncbi:BTAD domain-containing putative transcriptional regulator [Asanoa sp. NPDC049573]|uniref:AfsR/SARP family transcriptional regulator n=1 Tax=Asanoa sp. NPDC049573 TaxID=3155396 RepID=UPI003436A6F0
MVPGPAIELRVLGPLSLTLDMPRRLPPRDRDLLALLACRPNGSVPADRLVDALWPAEPPRTAAKALQVRVHELRRALGGPGRITHDQRGYALAVAPGELDSPTFEALVGQGRAQVGAGRLAAGAAVFRQALDLWRGPAFAGQEHLEPVRVEAARLTDLRLAAVEALADAELALGRHTEIVEPLRAVRAEHPLREALTARLMLALHRAGRPAEALRAYRELHQRLTAELDAEPTRALRDLRGAILTGDPALDLPAPAATRTRPAELPPDVPAFVGRAEEIESLRAALTAPTGSTSIAAVNGIGGVGKSALAGVVAAALARADAFPDGQLFVNLHGATAGVRPLAPADVLARFLRSLGIEPPHDVEEAAARFRSVTADRRLLLVLDNAFDAHQVRPLLPGGRDCAVLVTSRRVLSTLDGAVHLRLRPLAQDDALALLSHLAGGDRVAAERAAAADIARFCGLLPLALRVTGARLVAQPARSLASHADQLSDERRRLDALEHDDLAVRASIAASHQDLVGQPEVAGLLALVAGLDVPEVTAAVAGALAALPVSRAADALDRLVETQLLEQPANGRYRMHDLIRLFVRERAALEPDALVRVAEHYAAIGERATALLDPGQAKWIGEPVAATDDGSTAGALAWLAAEKVNIVGVVRQAAALPGRAGAVAIRLGAAFGTPLDINGFLPEWIDCNEVVAAVAARLGDRAAEARARMFLGYAYGRLGRHDDELAEVERALVLWRQVGDRFGVSGALNACGLAYLHVGRVTEAVDRLEAGLALRRAVGDRHGESMLLDNLGCGYRAQGRLDLAIEAHEKALALADEVDYRRLRAHALGNLAQDLRAAGDYRRALRYYRRSLASHRAFGDRHHEAREMWGLGTVLHQLGRDRPAREHWDGALAILQETGRLTAAEVAEIRRGPVDVVPSAIAVLVG